jgi:metal-responsive CopG/Arc/MetJ family transcriptional regulator
MTNYRKNTSVFRIHANLNMDSDVYTELRTLSQKQQVSMSNIVEKLVREYISKYREESQPQSQPQPQQQTVVAAPMANS